jgi:serine/threonine protein kinase/tetratricopeptide (TPR) repeat protein
MGQRPAKWHNSDLMPARDGTDPAATHTPVPAEGDGEELIGMVIEGRYRLNATVGRGGMGLVYKAAHVGLRRQVAVKILHPSLAASPDVRNRFEREALAVGKIDHPNCVQVYDSGRLPDGSLYLAMEFLDGKSLADVLEQEGQLAPGRALHILAHILRGLAHVHAAGLIHRDIKPENIFLVRQGDDVDFAKILDFGIAKGMTGSDLDEGVKLTQAGMAFGTPIYMAPEQALGNPMDGRADLYAAAVMGYEMLTGQPPFYSDDKLEVMSMHTAKPVPPMRQRLIKGGRPVPSSIERLIVKGLTKKPVERYASADMFLAAVDAALHTPDGGVTDVSIERVPRTSTTGSQPLVTEDGALNLADADIGAAIDEELANAATKPAPKRVMTPPSGAGPLPGSPKVALPGLPGMPPARGNVPQGGVGLGLPYTGPQGEAIFGLTPEQRLAGVQLGGSASDDGPTRVLHRDALVKGLPPRSIASTDPATSIAAALEPEDDRAATRPLERNPLGGSSKRWMIYVGAALCVAAGIAIAIISTRGSGGSDDVLAIDPDSLAGQANAALANGDPAKAITILEGNKVAIAQDALGQLVLGRAYAARHESAPSLEAYDRALRLKPEIERDELLRTSLRTMAGDADPNVVAAAFEIWVGKTKDPQAAPLLLKAAIAESLTRRHAVRPVIERLNLSSDVDWWVAYAYDLDQEETCELRKEAVARLRALDDPRAVPALERALARKVKSGPQRNKPYSPCLVADAKAAIGYLRGLPPKK